MWEALSCVLKKAINDPALNAVNRYEIFIRHIRSCLPRRAGNDSSNKFSNFFKNDLLYRPLGGMKLIKRQSILGGIFSRSSRGLPHTLIFSPLKSRKLSRRVLRTMKKKDGEISAKVLILASRFHTCGRSLIRFKNRHLGIVTPSSNSNTLLLDGIRSSMSSLCPSSSFHKIYFSLEDFPSNYFCKMFENPFTFEEFLSVICNARRRSFPGLDQIDYVVISALPEEHLRILLNIYNDLLNTELFPASWLTPWSS